MLDLETEDSSVCPWLLWLAPGALFCFVWPQLAWVLALVSPVNLVDFSEPCRPGLALSGMVGDRPWTTLVGLNHSAVSDLPKCGIQIAKYHRIILTTCTEISKTRYQVSRLRPRLQKSKSQHWDWDYESCSLSEETESETMNLIVSVTRTRLNAIVCDDLWPVWSPSMDINQ